MASRIKLEEKEKPFLNFKLRFEIPFSISAKKSLGEEFDLKVANENTDRSKKLRLFLLKKLNIKNEQELSKIKGVKECEEKFRAAIYDALGVTKDYKFSRFIKEEFIVPYLKDEA